MNEEIEETESQPAFHQRMLRAQKKIIQLLREIRDNTGGA